MKTLAKLCAIATFLLLYSCNFLSKEKDNTLSDQDVMDYIKVYKELREKGPDFLKNVNENVDSKGNEGFEKFENIIKEGGIKDYATFVKMNAKIGAIFSIAQGDKSVDSFGKMVVDGQKQFDEAIKDFDAKLNDPNFPEDAKEEIRKSKKEMQEAKKKLQSEWENNSKWANWVLEKTKKISGIIVNEKDIEVVMRHEKEIMEAYTGFTMPQISEIM